MAFRLPIPDRTVEVQVNSNTFTTVISPATVTVPVKDTGNNDVGAIVGVDVIVGDSAITNSDNSYVVDVTATANLVLPDQDIDVNGANQGSIPSVGTIDIIVTQNGNPTTLQSVIIDPVTRNITIDII